MRLDRWFERAHHRHRDEEAELDRILRAGSKTFYFASLVLPRRVRHPTLALYAFCRHADDDVDEASDTSRARAAVEALRARIERVYADRSLDDIVERRFAHVVQRYGIPRREPELLAEGMEWDVDGRTYPTLASLRTYALRVAGTVGVMMTYIMDRRDPRVLERARELGIGMQLTNIARDVGTDARLGRVYLPLDWLREYGQSPEELLTAPRATPAVRRAVSRLLNVADVHYERADEGISHLPVDCRVAIRAARLIYAEIGAVVRERECDSVSSRAVVSFRRKSELLARSLEAGVWRPKALDDVRADYAHEAS